MVCYGISILIGLLFNMLSLGRMAPDAKDIEILLLRQQLMLVKRKQKRGPGISRLERVMLLMLIKQLGEVKR